jgi:NDP-sugar pyrophosphorylase family protein
VVQSATRIVPAAPAVDVRLTPAYYLQADGLGPYVTGLLRRCPSVLGIKGMAAADLDHLTDLLPAESTGIIEAGAHIQGLVIVQAGARVEAGAHIIGPVLVCSGAEVAAGALVRDHSVIGPGCRIGFGAEVTRSMLAGDVLMKHPSFIGDSVIGRRVNIGAFCSTTGLRCDRGPVTIGDDVTLPAGTVLSPGTLIGPGTVIYPRDHVGGFLPAGSRVR